MSREVYLLNIDDGGDRSERWTTVKGLNFTAEDGTLFVPLSDNRFCNGEKYFYRKPRKTEEMEMILEEAPHKMNFHVMARLVSRYYQSRDREQAAPNFCDVQRNRTIEKVELVKISQ